MSLLDLFKKKQPLHNKQSEEDKAASFWKWFTENQHAYLFSSQMADKERDRLFDKLLEKLHQYNENLFFAMGGHPDSPVVEFVISAEGVVEFFPQVEALVDCSPAFKDWKIIAFKPPMLDEEFKIEIGGHLFEPGHILFIPLVSKMNPEKIGIKVCYPDYTEEKEEVFLQGTFLMLDTILGEKSSALDIDYVEVGQTPDNIADLDFGHLSDIHHFVSERKGA